MPDPSEPHDPGARTTGQTGGSAPLGRKLERPERIDPEPAPEKPSRADRKPVQGRARAAAGKDKSGSSERERGSRGKRLGDRGAGVERPRGGRQVAQRDTDRPFRPARKAAPRRPELPEQRPIIPRDAWRDLRATAPALALDDIVKAVGAATDALDEGDIDRATELLEWAKSASPRTATLREALGVVHYAAERYGQAHSELLTYRRLSGNQDQNHLLADCVRATGKPEKAQPYVDEMIAAGVEPARIAEGLLVLAGVRADAGDFEAALQTLQRAELDPEVVQPWHPRLWYAAADILERMGRVDEARDYFEAIVSVTDDFGDVDERLRRLPSE